jgi:hypothetical protein
MKMGEGARESALNSIGKHHSPNSRILVRRSSRTQPTAITHSFANEAHVTSNRMAFSKLLNGEMLPTLLFAAMHVAAMLDTKRISNGATLCERHILLIARCYRNAEECSTLQ